MLLSGPHGQRWVFDDTDHLAADGEDSLLWQLGRTWVRYGRGLASPIVGPDGDGLDLSKVGWSEGVAHALVAGAWFFDRDVRNLEDARALPKVAGNDGGVAIFGLVMLIAGMALLLIASCVDDPSVAEVLTVIGTILTIGGAAVAAAGGVPTSVCSTDPATGARVCAPLRI